MTSPAANGGEEPPPILGRWTVIYGVVLAVLAVTIVLLWMLTRAFT